MFKKQCSTCQIIKPIDQFSPSKKGLFGRVSQCKDCRRESQRKRRSDPEFRNKELERARAFDLERKETDRRRQWRKQYAKDGKMSIALHKWEKKNPGRRGAYDAIRRAIKMGRLAPAKKCLCSTPDCNRQAAHYHHHKGYDKAHRLDVVPLCGFCHGKTRHAFPGPSPA
jgi:hypothetical protein